MPEAKHDFLRYQIGRPETRPEQVAIYAGKKIIGYREGPGPMVSVFRLLGFGATQASAETMARATA
jgi:hypothetical protein